MKPAIMPIRNAGPASLTPVPGEEQPTWGALRDLAYLLGSDAGSLAGRLAPRTIAAIGDLVRGMRVAFPLGQSERLFPHLWVPSEAATAAMPPELEEALQAP